MSNIFWSNLFKKQPGEVQTIAELWQNTPLFKDIPTRHIEFLAAKMHPRQFQPEEIIFQQGDQGAGAVLVMQGSVRVMANKTQLALLEVGDFFGEIALAETDNRAADAYSIGYSTLVFFLKQDLEEWVEVEPRPGARLLMNLASTLAQRLYQANQLIANQ